MPACSGQVDGRVTANVELSSRRVALPASYYQPTTWKKLIFNPGCRHLERLESQTSPYALVPWRNRPWYRADTPEATRYVSGRCDLWPGTQESNEISLSRVNYQAIREYDDERDFLVMTHGQQE